MGDHGREGMEALGRGDYRSALRSFQAARKAQPGDRRLEAYRAWARYQVLKSASASAGREQDWLNDTAVGNCKTIIQAAVASTADFDDGHVFLGRMLLDEGEDAKAADAFRSALRIDSSSTSAGKYLSVALGKPNSTPGSSIVARVGSWWKRIGTGKEGEDAIGAAETQETRKTST